MFENERTRDLYEEIPGYPKPPLVPLPEPGNLDSLGREGLKPSIVSHGIVRAAMFATGFNAFQQQLPYTLENLLRRTNLRLPGLFAPVISATLVLEDDPRDLSPVERAATLVFAARSLYQDITSGELEADRYQDQILEMGLYPNLFSTSLILDGGRARLFKSTDVSRITVVIARRFYSLPVGDLESGATIQQLQEALSELGLVARKNRLKADRLSPGILTCATNKTQRKAFRQLQESEINARSLSALRHSFLTLCLDLDSYPSSHAEAAFVAHSGNPANRWYQSSLQLVVFGNAKACAICSFTAYLDGNTMMRAASEIQKRAAGWSVEDGAAHTFVSLPAATELDWEIDEDLVQRAQRDLRSVHDNQQATFEITGIGTEAFTAHGVEPVPAFIVALQMAAWRLTGEMVRIEQFLTMSKYRCMSLVTGVVTTPEMMRFVDYMNGESGEHDRALALLREAVDSQARACRDARRHLPLASILSLFARSRRGAQRPYVVSITVLTMILLRMLGLFKPVQQREIIVSHPAVYPEVPLVGRPGFRLPYARHFGLHYQILEDRIVITMMPGVDWLIPNAEVVAVLRESLERIQEIVGGEEERQQAQSCF